MLTIFTLAFTQLASLANAETTITLWDDNTSFWTAGSYITMSYDYDVYQSGTLAVKVIISGGTSWIYRDYGTNQDFSGLTDYWLHFWWYGNGSTANVYLSFTNSTQTGHRYYYFYDTPAGWTEHRIQLKNMYNSGPLDWSTVRYMFFGSLDNLNTFRMDNVHLVLEDDEEVTSEMISQDWIGFSALLFMAITCLVLTIKPQIAILNFTVGVLTIGLAASLLGADIILAGWFNVIAMILAAVCMISGYISWRSA